MVPLPAAPPSRWPGWLTACAFGAGIALLAVAIVPPDEPLPLATDRNIDYWIQVDGEGATPTRLERLDVRFRAHVPLPRVVLSQQQAPLGGKEPTGIVLPLRITNLNRDVAQLVPVEEVREGKWLSPTTFYCEVEIRPNASTTVEFRDAAPGEPVRFFATGDPELNWNVLDRFAAAARKERPAFVWIVGDLFQEQDWLGEAYLERFESAEVPVYVAIGNHDLLHDRRRGPFEARKEYFRRLLGPTDYAFDFRGAQFVALDTAAPYVAPAQLEWLEKTLATGEPRPRLIFTHKPWVDPRPGESHTIESPWDCERLAAILARTPRVVYYCGHIEGYYTYEASGVPVRIVGSLTRESMLERDEGGRNGYVAVRLGPDGPIEERVEMEPTGLLGDLWGLVAVTAVHYPRHHPEGPLGGLLVLVALAGAVRAWRRRRRDRRAASAARAVA